MSNPFYKYLVEELLVGYFRKNIPSRGNRYYIVIENDEYRRLFVEAFREIAEDITINNIYDGAGYDTLEEEYKTMMLPLGGGAPGIIFGSDKDATEDYLTTIRNSVGVSGSPYENYCLLLVLSDSILSSIITACQDLQAPGEAFSVSNIIGSIKNKLHVKFIKDYERMYFERHLEKISEYIEDGTCTLFDFGQALSMLERGCLRQQFNCLDFFDDSNIYSANFKPKNEAMRARIEANHTHYRQIRDIMNAEDDVDKLSKLQKVLDEKLAKKICSLKDEWSSIDYQEIVESVNRKTANGDLELKSVELLYEGLTTTMIYNPKDGSKKRTKNHIIICDRSAKESQELKITFNKKATKVEGNIVCQMIGSIAKVKLTNRVVHLKFGVNDNYHDFVILRIPFDQSFFHSVRQNITLKKNGTIVINVPNETDSLKLGSGANEKAITYNATIPWNDDDSLILPLDSVMDDKIPFSIEQDGIKVNFELKVNSAQPIPPVGPNEISPMKQYKGVECKDSPFGKITDGEVEYPVKMSWRQFLEWEKILSDTHAVSLHEYSHDLTGQTCCEALHHELPSCVQSTLSAIYDYYSRHDTVPSLTPLNEELRSLYNQYLYAVSSVIDAISQRPLREEEYNLTKLGVVESNGKVYLSPFHPVLVAYSIELDKRIDWRDVPSFVSKLLTPFYLLPYMWYNDIAMRTSHLPQLSDSHHWLCYEQNSPIPQARVNDITTTVVCQRIREFISHYDYLFQEKDCPVIVSCVGIRNDVNVIKGILKYITKDYSRGVQKIELHEYVENLMDETFYEKLNRLDSQDAIIRALDSVQIKLDSGDDYSSQEIIHLLFTRVSLYKHSLSECKEQVSYSHIAFYMMDSGENFIRMNTSLGRTELALNGLISIPSTLHQKGTYIIGYGNKGVNEEDSIIHQVSSRMNNLYANEQVKGSNTYQSGVCVAKSFEFRPTNLLQSIYKHSCWVTFINPEVDINFFYRQEGCYVVHYTDQYSINAKYDSITVTHHVEQYENMLRRSYSHFALDPELFDSFNQTMMKYFNCLNGSWMLGIVRKSELQIREKMSIVAACIVMLRFMKRVKNVIWIPLSLEEILRVTGSIGLSKEHIFTKQMLGVKGAMSDDILMMGLEMTDTGKPKLYLYPIEVKYSDNSVKSTKAIIQVSQTYRQLKKHLVEARDFVNDIYRTFFASQFLTAAEKLNANYLLSDEDYSEIEKKRYSLLNGQYEMSCDIPIPEIGDAAVVSFLSNIPHSMETTVVDGTTICHLVFSESECFTCVSTPERELMHDLEQAEIISSNAKILSVSEEDEEIVDTRNDVAEVSNQTSDATSEISGTIQSKSEDNTNEIIPILIDEHISTPEQKSQTLSEPALAPAESIQIVLGSTQSGRRSIIFEPNNTRRVSHPNMAIIGTMGTGKTQLARSVIAQFSKETHHNVGQSPIGMLIFDYKGDYKDDIFLNAVGGESYRYNFPFNPLKLVITDDVAGMNLPAITADRLSDSFAKAYGLGLKQQSCIKQVIIETYADAGITRDPKTWNNTVPSMEQVIDKYFETYDANDKAYALFDKLRDYTIFASEPAECVSLFEWLDKVRVIDLTIYPDDTKKVIVSLILDLFYAEMQQLGGSLQQDGFRELRAMIMVDEAHQFLKKDFNSLRKIISEGRMFGVGMILSSQNISDFRSTKEDYTSFILSWVIHHVNSISKSEITGIFGASDPHLERYMEFINRACLFESVCKIGNQVEGIRDLPFFELIREDDRFSSVDS